MLPNQLRDRLAQFPRLPLAQLPTPLEPLPRLTAVLGGPALLIKRDDNIGPAFGGNKGRKLAFLLAEVLRRGQRKVITYGGLQSNHARMTAAACAHLGLEAHLFFFEKRPSTLQGNLFLDALLGAKLHFIPFGGGGDASMTLEATNRLVRLVSAVLVGPGAYFMPVGGHTVTGCLGYVDAALEIHEQAVSLGLDLARVTVLTAAGSGGTLAGLLAGFTLLGSPIRALGIDVGKLWKAFPASLARLAGELCAALGEVHTFHPADVPLIEGTYVGPGYAVLTDASRTAVRLLARTEGILLDPVYTGKALAGLMDLVGNGRFTPDETVIFLHTGGFPGLWAFSGMEIKD
ncbi:MAG: D-cysteine desulfhydrase family protein [Ardenticatenaceae bacterium]|nr:D-cysteine desulfhydrase family protein [Ardenticatenaceae bacterium]